MKHIALLGALVGLTVSAIIFILPEITGLRVMFLYPWIFILSPSFFFVERFPLHGAPILIAIGIFVVLFLINMILYAGVAALFWSLMEQSSTNK